MTHDVVARLAALTAEVDHLTRQRYPGLDRAEADAQAAELCDVDYLQARLRLAEAQHQAAAVDLLWMAPGQVAGPRESLARIRTLCAYHPNLYDAVLTVLATHPRVAKEVLAQALRHLRPDLDGFSNDDVAGMLTAAWVGGREGFEAVMRTRKNAARKATALPWSSG